MTYNVRFTDQDKADLTVFDNTSNTDTTLVFPGRNTTGYGQTVAENFLHILENFASASEPISPIEGQLWYDSGEETLKISDGLNWKSANGIYKGPVEPGLDSSREGELWIDTTNQQLRIFNGARWILVGPSQTSIAGLKYGPTVETVDDTDSVKRSIVVFYVADVPVTIISKDSFIPKVSIPGFPNVRAGLNINDPQTSAQKDQFQGGNLPKLVGTAIVAESMLVSTTGDGVVVPAARFLRSDVVNTTESAFNIRDNAGLTIGRDQNFNLSTGSSGARIYNSFPNSSINLQINRGGLPDTIVRIQDNKVGINNNNPQQELDLNGNAAISGSLALASVAESTNINNGSFKTAGGAAIAKNLRVGSNVILNETPGTVTQTREIRPESNDTHDLGTVNRRWKTVHVKNVKADSIEGVLLGNIDGNAKTATSLQTPTSFQLSGDVISQAVTFDGQVGNYTKVFNTSLTSNIILSKPEPPDGESQKGDYLLVFRPSESGSVFSGLIKQTRDNFVADLGLPIGAVLPYAGLNPPLGFLLCDGSEVQKAQFPDLYNIISDFYNGTAPLLGANTFRLPDLRGRNAMGRDNMDNALSVPLPSGGFTDAGGGKANRVPDAAADSIAGSGGSSVSTLTLANLPEHSHSLTTPSGSQFFAVRNDPAVSPPATTGPGGTAILQAQYLNDSGGIKKPSLGFTFGQPINTMNPYLTLNYIIRSGPPVFTVT
jgi:microcystin-dependent protein